MSQIKLSPNASGTGDFTIASPNGNTNRTLTLPDVSGTFLTNATTTGFPAGSVLQVAQTIKTNTFTTTSSSFVDVTGMSVNITPSSASNKILVLLNSNVSNNAANSYVFVILTDGTDILRGDADGSAGRCLIGGNMVGDTASLGTISACWLHSPNTTSQKTYKMQIRSQTSGTLVSVNRPYNGSTANDAFSRGASTITVMEIAA
jgi:hypothetical protein